MYPTFVPRKGSYPTHMFSRGPSIPLLEGAIQPIEEESYPAMKKKGATQPMKKKVAIQPMKKKGAFQPMKKGAIQPIWFQSKNPAHGARGLFSP